MPINEALPIDYLQRLPPGVYLLGYTEAANVVPWCRRWQGVTELAVYQGRFVVEPQHSNSGSPDFTEKPSIDNPCPGERVGNLIRNRDRWYIEMADVEKVCVEYMDEEATVIEAWEMERFLETPEEDDIAKTRFFDLKRVRCFNFQHG